MVLYGIIIAILFLSGLRRPTAGVFGKEIVTVLKPFLAFGIVFHHLHGEAIYLLDFERWGPIVVGIFFFISGYGLTYSLYRRHDYMKNFFRDKILIKLMLPSSLALFISLAIPQQWDEFSIPERLACPQGPWMFANDWFIYALIYCYLAFMVAGKAKSSQLRLSILVIAPLLLVLFTSHMNYARNWWATPMAFSVGALYSHYEPRIRQFGVGKKKYLVSVACLLFIFGGLLGLYKVYGNRVSTVLAYSLLPLLLVCIITRLDVNRLAQNKLILFFGGISFEIYLIHGIVIGYFKTAHNLEGTILIVTSLVVTIITAYIFKQITTICQNGITNLLPRAYTI